MLGLHKGTARAPRRRGLARRQELVARHARRRCASSAASEMAMIFQDPLSALHPYFTVGAQIAEAYRVHNDVSKKAARAPRHRDARPRRHPRPGQARRRLPAPVLRRHAPARDDRHVAVVQPRAAHRRRAHHRARRHGAGADPRPHARPAEGVRLRDHHDHPRPRASSPSSPTTSSSCTAARRSSTARSTTSSTGREHPYTWGLLSSVTRLDRLRTSGSSRSPGQPPSLINVPSGCAFHPRCPYERDPGGERARPRCPDCSRATPGHRVRCHIDRRGAQDHLRRAGQADAVSRVREHDAPRPSPGRRPHDRRRRDLRPPSAAGGRERRCSGQGAAEALPGHPRRSSSRSRSAP